MRVTGTRVPLDTIVAAFDAGATPEEIVQQYPTIDIKSAYAIVSYVLANRESVDAYLARRRAQAQAVREEAERRFPPEGIRARLDARMRMRKA
jgi:uncharacterized protein (DUF433 family)